MKLSCITNAAVLILLIGGASLTSEADAASPTAEQALRLAPIQKGIDYDQPDKDVAAKCKITSYKENKQVGWVVEDPEGETLRRFTDTNGDNMVDQWSYFKDGVEVYRDIDSNFNGKADQYRWFHTGGSRWALDKNEDGEIDSWKVISPEEVTAEIVAAIANQDPARFARVALTAQELKDLGLGQVRSKQVAEKLGQLNAEFTKLSTQQKLLTTSARWVQFSGGQPGTIPAGTEGSTEDITAYENVVAIVETEGKHGQIQIGTLVRVGDTWRAIELPRVHGEGDNQTAASGSGFFFHAPTPARTSAAAGAPNDQIQRLIESLTELDKKGPGQAGYPAKRADILEQIAEAAGSPEEKELWIRELANGVMVSVQDGSWPEGIKRLESLLEKLDKQKQTNAAACVAFRILFINHDLKIAAGGKDEEKQRAEWLKQLEAFVNEFPKSIDASEAMLQLAMNEEFAAKEDAAKKWYARIVKEFANSPAGRRAAGALARLGSEGQVLNFQGRSPKGDVVDLSKYRGRVVLLQYWATWNDTFKTEMPALKELFNKYAKSGFAVIGVNLDSREKDLNTYLTENTLPWPVIFEDGALDSRPATELGIVQVPTMILIGKDGKVLDRNIRLADLDGKLKELLR